LGKKKKQNKNVEPQEEMKELLGENEDRKTEELETRAEGTFKGDESPQGEPFDPEKHGVPGLDELALRLQVPPTEDTNRGIVMWGKSGRAYAWVDLLGTHLEYTSQAVMHTMQIHQKINELLEKIREEMKNELDKRS